MARRGRKNCDEALILALASGTSVPTAAKQVGCSVSTARRRLADAAFRSRVEETRTQLVRDAFGRLARLGKRAAKELLRLIAKGDSDSVELGAARAALDFMFRGAETDILARQIDELRRRLDERDKDNGTGKVPPSTDGPGSSPPDTPGEGPGTAGSHPPRSDADPAGSQS